MTYRRGALQWCVLSGAVLLFGTGLDRVGVPAAFLLAALAAGVAHSLRTKGSLAISNTPMLLAQAVIGVSAGSYVQRNSIESLLNHWAPVVVGSVGTLAISVGAGLALARVTGLDASTASFGMVAGGASGIVAMSDDLGADDRIVAVMQYLRVILVMAAIPLVAGTIFATSVGSSAAGATSSTGLIRSLGFLATCTGVGLAIWRFIPIPVGALLPPMLVAALLTVFATRFAATPPTWVVSAALAVIGLRIGLRFTTESLRTSRRILPASVATILLMVVVCALVGVLIAPLAHVSSLDGYLATSPGGLPAVLGAISSGGTDGTFVVSMQVVRVVLMLLVAPSLAPLLHRFGGAASYD